MAVPCKGVRGPLTPIRPRPARSRAAGPGSRDSDEQLAGGKAGIAGMPVYRLADYLDQHGRRHRQGQFPPAGFWAAAASHASPGDQAALGDAAHDRGLYRDAAQLHKNAAARGTRSAVFYLSGPPPYFRADDRPPALGRRLRRPRRPGRRGLAAGLAAGGGRAGPGRRAGRARRRAD